MDVIRYHTCRFEGSRRKKSQVLITNGKVFRKWIGLGLTCSKSKFCDRIGLPHLKRRPTVSGGRVVQFKTGDEREYPVGFCDGYGYAAWSLVGPEGSFIAIFSGPNAPLSHAVARISGANVPGRINTKGSGVTNELTVSVGHHPGRGRKKLG